MFCGGKKVVGVWGRCDPDFHFNRDDSGFGWDVLVFGLLIRERVGVGGGSCSSPFRGTRITRTASSAIVYGMI